MLRDEGDAQCRQVVTTEGVDMWREPCWTITETTAPVQSLKQWDTFNYIPGSKQTSICADGHFDQLCWVKATTDAHSGWMPVGNVPNGERFDDSVCSTNSPGATALVQGFCGKLNSALCSNQT
jgi:hypothetical protein